MNTTTESRSMHAICHEFNSQRKASSSEGKTEGEYQCLYWRDSVTGETKKFRFRGGEEEFDKWLRYHGRSVDGYLRDPDNDYWFDEYVPLVEQEKREHAREMIDRVVNALLGMLFILLLAILCWLFFVQTP